jgi:hypothetical protein
MGQTFNPQDSRLSTSPDALSMVERVMEFFPASDAEALKLLRTSFPDAPLSLRVAALDFLTRRKSRGRGQIYRPR